MSAAILRDAATKLRAAATEATGAPWSADGCADGSQVNGAGTVFADRAAFRNDATYIALVDPTVGLALADWLDAVASGWMWDSHPEDMADLDGWPLKLEESVDSLALATARAILGGGDK